MSHDDELQGESNSISNQKAIVASSPPYGYLKDSVEKGRISIRRGNSSTTRRTLRGSFRTRADSISGNRVNEAEEGRNLM